ncbi:hypothetical protein KNE206_52950 [Kitasatospora sp. NE20-6]|uniref:hypothetical protein n=1 Tax=Kitasatospora sp. NE20-6 TaxID=2859066 RepID=UPI0034DBC7FB
MRLWRRKKKRADGRFHQALAELSIPTPFSIEQFCANIAAARGRPIEIHSMEVGKKAATAPCGLWIAFKKVDVIFVEEATSPLHRSHIILHELCHMLLGHWGLPSTDAASPATDGPRADADELPFSLSEFLAVEEWPAVPHGAILSILGRTSYTTEHEQDAEALAGVVAKMIRKAEAAASGPRDELMNHLMNAFGKA